MTRPAPVALSPRSVVFLLLVFGSGLFLAGVATFSVAADGFHFRNGLEFLAVPLTMLIARFPMLIDRADGGIEVGFDSAVLMFLLCTLSPTEAVFIWFLGVVASQLTSDKRALYRCGNIGMGVIGGAVSAAVVSAVRGNEYVGTPRELAAVALAAVSYFVCDYALTAIGVSLESEA